MGEKWVVEGQISRIEAPDIHKIIVKKANFWKLFLVVFRPILVDFGGCLVAKWRPGAHFA
jgi:hypothetical protein